MAAKKAPAKAKAPAKKASAKAKGSDVIKARGFDEAKLKRMMAALKKLRLDPDIIINGKPRPDLIKGTFKARNGDGLAAGLREIFVFEARYKVPRFLINGQPWPDEFLVQFEARANG